MPYLWYEGMIIAFYGITIRMRIGVNILKILITQAKKTLKHFFHSQKNYIFSHYPRLSALNTIANIHPPSIVPPSSGSIDPSGITSSPLTNNNQSSKTPYAMHLYKWAIQLRISHSIGTETNLLTRRYTHNIDHPDQF